MMDTGKPMDYVDEADKIYEAIIQKVDDMYQVDAIHLLKEREKRDRLKYIDDLIILTAAVVSRGAS